MDLNKFAIIAGMIVLATAAGYLVRRRGLLSERVGELLMTFVSVAGYPAVGFLSIWPMPLQAADTWLPLLAALHVGIMTVLGIAAGRVLGRDRGQTGVFAIASALGNNLFTMGGLVAYLLYSLPGLGLVSIYSLAWTPIVVLIIYPVARHYSSRHGGVSLGRLMVRNLLDWRSIGLPVTVVAVFLAAMRIPMPQQIGQWHVVDLLVYTITPLAYFSIGLRVHASQFLVLRRLILGLAGMRFVAALLVGLALAQLTLLTPWPLTGLAWKVYIIEAFVPTAVTMAAVANMFGLKPREASVLFVANTVMYVTIVLPVVLWLF
jgi:predicted permease